MAPAKLGRKKRVPPPSAITETAAVATAPSAVGALAATGTLPDASSAASTDPQALAFSGMSIDTAAAYYGHLRSDSNKVLFRLGGSQWLHQIVAVAAVNVLMYDLHVRTHQMLLAAWAALWLGRGFVIEQSFKMVTRANVKGRILIGRVIALIAFVGAALSLHYHVSETIPRHAIIELAIVLGVDILSIRRIRNPLGFAHAALSDIGEMVFVVLIFSTQFNELSHLIYDRVAIAFVVGTLVVHASVVHGVQYALYAMPWTDEGQSNQNERRRQDAVKAVAHNVDLGDDEKPTTPGKRKKGFKPSSVTGSSTALMKSQADGSVVVEQMASSSAFGSLEMVTHCLALQALSVAVQILATAFVLHSWELCSIGMITSIYLLIEVLLLHSSLAGPHPLHTSVQDVVGAAFIP